MRKNNSHFNNSACKVYSHPMHGLPQHRVKLHQNSHHARNSYHAHNPFTLMYARFFNKVRTHNLNLKQFPSVRWKSMRVKQYSDAYCSKTQLKTNFHSINAPTRSLSTPCKFKSECNADSFKQFISGVRRAILGPKWLTKGISFQVIHHVCNLSAAFNRQHTSLNFKLAFPILIRGQTMICFNCKPTNWIMQLTSHLNPSFISLSIAEHRTRLRNRLPLY